MPNTHQFNFTVVICAFVALVTGVSTYSYLHTPIKGDRLTPAPIIARPAAPPVVETPAAPEPSRPEPVAAGPAPSETAPPAAVKVAHPIRKPSKRRARRIAKAKAEPCVGPLCVLVQNTSLK